ncbi:MAG: hypothetical protein IIW92_03470 [Lachnospiraceae bacterium]|nr:hypothetical protein [Lachnospiraceae bacterium]
MAINVNSNFHLGSKTFLDSRESVGTLDDLLALDTNIIPNGFECYVEELDCKYKYHKDYNEVGTGNWKLKIGGSGGDTAENIAYVNADYSQYSNVDLALDALFAKVYYVKPTCSLSASPTGGTFEMGTTITAPITFTWTTNKDITTQTLSDCILADETVRTATYDIDISSDKTFTLSVSDGENNASSSVSYKFMNNVFWGSAAAADAYDSTFVNALSNKKLTNSVKGTYSFNVADGEYGFWAVPSNMTISTVWIGGFEVTVDDLGTVSYTNAQGYTRDYKLYKTGKASLGVISAEIK